MIKKIKKIGHIAQTLRHLFAFSVNNKTVVHPVIREGLSESNSLGAFVFVVWELEVHTTAVQIESFSQNVKTHDDTFAMPTRSTVAPGRRPCWFAWLAELP